MGTCIFCNTETNFLTQHKIKDGVVCQSCCKKIPRVLWNALSTYDVESVRSIMNYEAEMRAKDFAITASYGKLHLDEMRGRIAIASKKGSSMKLPEDADVFDLLYLKEIGLYPKNIRQVKSSVRCDVELYCDFQQPEMTFTVIVAQNIKCESHPINKNQISWSEPGELSMIRSMLQQAIRTAGNRARQKPNDAITPYEFALAKARACFHISEDYSQERLDSQYEAMTQMYRHGTYDAEDALAQIAELKRNYDLLCSIRWNPSSAIEQSGTVA